MISEDEGRKYGVRRGRIWGALPPHSLGLNTQSKQHAAYAIPRICTYDTIDTFISFCHLDNNDSCLPIYKTIPAMCNTTALQTIEIFLKPSFKNIPGTFQELWVKQSNSTARSQNKGNPPPPNKKLIFPFENRATAPSPNCPSPHPGAHWFIVVYLRLATGQSDQSCPPGCNLMMP